ncbi:MULTISPECIES: bifunctional glycosyltransferase/CDP-glycerol:glycerophosphate glycerophosphotransferase [Streptomyces]|uniref:Bifunctional glycosyltransferase/CDP-glycerol:glycerophosphate glycerophosphotransferase n=1 Tax=Streptomyces violaceolatus TaxID=67378 RepID=A0ABN3T6X7_9ACTN|nr:MULTISPECIES: bifunctional glycosyltransferase/CDP-glycerol:glycerophosphate glycerophosphotransferase [Streptomyces]MDX3322594.1 CDP-glycerol glycerophosphotransferase family protein [Streptomyces sp. ME03-5684b]MDX3400034.1 CDP-glycerol glycerophosphotransferase family protein [Streptomyces sp. ME01-18h]WSB63324.1 CDP-glycerol glycerophosphotransferase family protein [Streptomyces anthocyanicus]WTC08838.1 CDP-glycerol glycerophosphotransferase family protein [Streptomyces anthocyanicus]WT
MPRFSLIVPVHKVQGYLPECLDSVLGQDYVDFELIAVNDCSPDGSGAILDEYARHDARIHVMHLTENVGLGRARNAGMERAQGDYVLFLDSDDTLTEGALTAIADRLDATDDPEVLVYDYARTYWNGRVSRNQRADLLRDTGPDVFSLADRPQLLDLLQIVWNKAYRRDFIARTGLTFPPGYYEDAPWTFGSLITAERIALLDRVCVYYRQRREGGNILKTVSRKHFDIFDQYRRVFDYVDAHEELAEWRGPLFRKMVDHYLTVLESPGRLPRDARAEFFHRASADYRARVPKGFTRPGGGRGHKYTMLERDAYTTLMSALAAVKARRRVKKGIRGALNRSKRGAMGAFYQSQLRLPLDDNLALFSAYWSRGVSCNPAAIDAELARLAPGMRRVWAVHADHADRVPKGVRVVRVGSREYWTALARAKYLVNNVNFADSVVKREGQIHVQTHHGTPLKTMGLDQQKYPASTDMDFEKLLERCDRWDYSISSNRFSTVIWERVYPCSYATLETGYPRNDVLVNATAEDVRAARAALGLADGTKAFLYMPTHREYQPGFTSALDPARFARELGPDVTLLVRGHYFYGDSPQTAALRRTGRIVDVSGHSRVEDLYLAADALITDYSSAMFDYAVLDRPIVSYVPDWDVYSAVRGTYFDLLQEPPGAVATTQTELLGLLTSGTYDTPETTKRRDGFRRRFCEFDDGRAAERVVRHVFLGEESLLPVVPFDDRSHAPTPAQALEPVERA